MFHTINIVLYLMEILFSRNLRENAKTVLELSLAMSTCTKKILKFVFFIL